MVSFLHFRCAFGQPVLACLIVLAASSCGVVAQSPTSSLTSSGTSVTYTIIGVETANQTDLDKIPLNFTIWGEIPVTVVDTFYNVVANLLNGVSPGTTPEPPDRRAQDLPGTTSAGGDSSSEPMKWYWILLIALGGAVGVTAMVLAIYFGVNASKKSTDQAKTVLLPQETSEPGQPNLETGGCIGFLQPHGGKYTKVIQVPIACARPPQEP